MWLELLKVVIIAVTTAVIDYLAENRPLLRIS